MKHHGSLNGCHYPTLLAHKVEGVGCFHVCYFL